MNILITGGTGFIGNALIQALSNDGHHCTLLTRNPEKARKRMGDTHRYIEWNAMKNSPPEEAYDNIHVIINLMGEGIAEKRWSNAQKHKIRNSRILGTRYLVEGAVKYAKHLHTWINASAIGIYNHRLLEDINHDSQQGDDFLATVCQEWEAASKKISSQEGVREVRIRIGVVLGKEGGALSKMKRPFYLGLGGRLGSGSQYMNWIHIDDIIGIITHAIKNKELRGATNAVSPGNCSNSDFTKTLGKVIHRPTIFPLPGFVLKLLLGELADSILIGGKVVPTRLLDSGYSFKFPNLEDALKEALKKDEAK